jgi:hypothetical protein
MDSGGHEEFENNGDPYLICCFTYKYAIKRAIDFKNLP